MLGFKIKKIFLLSWCSIALSFPSTGQNLSSSSENDVTCSILAFDTTTGEIGLAIVSNSFAIGSHSAYGMAGKGAVVLQSILNTKMGIDAIDYLEKGTSPSQVIDLILKDDTISTQRQVGIINNTGVAVGYTGNKCPAWAGHYIGDKYLILGCGLTSGDIVKGTARRFEISTGALANRLLSGLESFVNLGDTLKKFRSAALFVWREYSGIDDASGRYIDLRVDDYTSPVVELKRLYQCWEEKYLLGVQFKIIAELKRQRKFITAEQETQRIVSMLNEKLRLYPDNADVLNRLAMILATQDIDYQRALELSKRAVKLSPTNYSYLATLAECHFRLGNFNEAIAICSELVAKDPTNDLFWKQLLKYKESREKAGQK